MQPQPNRSNRDTGGLTPSPSLQERNTTMKNTITITEAAFGAMYDAINIAYERLIINNCHGDECPYMAIMQDAIDRAEEEL